MNRIDETVKFKGTVDHVVYPRGPREPGSYAVFKFTGELIKGEISDDTFVKLDDGRYYFTVAGNAPEITKEVFEITGVVMTSKYGYQFNITNMDPVYNFDNKEDQKRFFTYAVSETVANNLIKTFDNPMNVVEREDVTSLMTVDGVGRKTALKIIEKYKANRQNAYAYIKLSEYGMSKRILDKLCKQFGSSDTLVRLINKNPYLLIQQAEGIGWVKADTVARAHGMALDDPRRIGAYIDYYFRNKADSDGDVWHNLDDVIAEVHTIAPNADDTKIGIVIKEAIEAGSIYYEKETRRIGAMYYRKIESKIASELHRLSNGEHMAFTDIEDTIKECERKVGFEYSQEQRDAIYKILNNNVSILTARGGCGKTSLMYPVTQVMKKHGFRIGQCALAGRAALNLSDMTGIEGQTIHRILGWLSGEFAHNEYNKLPYDMIILDEVSMVGGQLFYDLIKAIKTGAKLVLVGDTGQLESIGFSNCMKDIIESECIPHCHLTKIFRQALRSGIIKLSSDVYEGIQTVKSEEYGEKIIGELQDLKLVTVEDDEKCINEVIKNFKELYFDKKIPLEDILICVAKRNIGNTSARALNEKIQELVIGKQAEGVRWGYYDKGSRYEVVYHVGDRVKVTKNSYNMALVGTKGETEDVFNGNVGTIKTIEPYTKTLTISFPQGTVIFGADSIEKLQLGYVITTHSAQGIGMPYVICLVDPTAYMMLSKEFAYTALSRAKKYCVCVTTPRAIRRAVETTRVYTKRTWLAELIKAEFGAVNCEKENTQ